MTENKERNITLHCPVCRKAFKTQTYICRKGLLKDQKMVKRVFCHRKCEEEFELALIRADMYEKLTEKKE